MATASALPPIRRRIVPPGPRQQDDRTQEYKAMNSMSRGPHRQQGAALVIGLILLVVLTILAVSGVFTSTMELRMVRNTQSQEHAFQAAEVAVEDALANPVLRRAPFSARRPWPCRIPRATRTRTTSSSSARHRSAPA
jgi:hypothetical protein